MIRQLTHLKLSSLSDVAKLGNGDAAIVLTTVFKFLTISLFLIIMTMGMQSPVGLRLVFAGFLTLLLLILIRRFPLWGLSFTFLFLVLLGGIRRWLIPDLGWIALDPLILISPTISLVIFLQIVISRNTLSDTPLNRFLKYLLIIMALEVFNPLQGGLLVGFGGILFYVIPLLWFYVGRLYGNIQVLLFIFNLAVSAIALAAVYGLKQVFFGLSSSEEAWVSVAGYAGIFLGSGTIRVFSTFASQQEFAAILSCAISICGCFVFHKKLQYLLPLCILLPSLFYTGTRGPVVSALIATCVQWALMGRNKSVWLPRLGLAFVLGIAGLFWSLSSASITNSTGGQGDLLRHQQEGLLTPGQSTAPGHLMLVGSGVIYGFTHPLGAGLGATTLAAGKLGAGGEGFGAETDHGNMFISLGIVGGLLYLIVNFFVFKQVLALWNSTRNIVFLILIGLLIANFSQWLNGALYSLSFLTWISIGIMDRHYSIEINSKINFPNKFKKSQQNYFN